MRPLGKKNNFSQCILDLNIITDGDNITDSYKRYVVVERLLTDEAYVKGNANYIAINHFVVIRMLLSDIVEQEVNDKGNMYFYYDAKKFNEMCNMPYDINLSEHAQYIEVNGKQLVKLSKAQMIHLIEKLRAKFRKVIY